MTKLIFFHILGFFCLGEERYLVSSPKYIK
jgi:hypothetical protein